MKKQNENILQFLVERWTHQLQIEYDNICYQYGIKLRKPLIGIDQLKNSWGFWDKNRKTILISENLIKKYSWDIVTQVLKHEMAHQIVSDIYCVEEGHGNYFKQACKILGLEGKFSQSSISLEEQFIHWKNEKEDSEELMLLNKIQKLLNLAQSSNEHESALAMEKVQEIYEKYNIQKIKLGQSQEYYSLILNFKKKKVPASHASAAHILQSHFMVRIVFSSLYDSAEDSTHKTIELFGTRQNVLMAEYVFYFLIDRIELLWKNYSKNKQIGVRYKLSFQQGILDGFLKKLDSAKEIRHMKVTLLEPNLNSLIRLNELKLRDFIHLKYPKLTNGSRSSSGIYTEHFQEGFKEGKKISINKPIQNESKNLGRFLQPS